MVLLGVAVRLAHLDADPQYYDWVGYVTDEGRWVQFARSLALHGAITESHLLDLHFFLAPLFQLIHFSIFQIAGVSFVSARIFSALCGSALLMLFCLGLRRQVGGPALLLGAAMIALQPDLVALSRVAVPEMAALFFQLVVYMMLVANPRASWRMVGAGVGLLAACAIKATMLLVLPVFVALLWLMPRRPGEPSGGRESAIFLGAFFLPLATAGLAGYGFFAHDTYLWAGGIRRFLSAIGDFLLPANLYALFSFPFAHSLAAVVNLWSLGLWLGLLACRVRRDDRDFELHRRLVTAAVWCGGYLLLMLCLNYAPARYLAHVLLPLAIVTTVGCALAQRVGLAQIAASFDGANRLRALASLALLALPTAALAAPLLAGVAAWFGVDSQRLAAKFFWLLAAQLAISLVGYRLRRQRRVMEFLVVFPLMTALLWAASAALGRSHAFWPMAQADSWFVSYSVIVLIGLGLAAAAICAARGGLLTSWRALAACALCYFMALLIKDVPSYLDPRYSMKQASRDIGTLAAGYSSIVNIRAESLFLENKLAFRTMSRRAGVAAQPQILVVAFLDAHTKETIERDYRLLKSYDIHVAADYFRDDPQLRRHHRDGVAVSVYRRKDL